ncbi:MAG TPA: hypothetical protein VJ546_04770 [Bacillales bacterium]|nr:hypothetical protein [Bacillales bacterium]
MEGEIFYWISWSIWVYLTFIFRKEDPNRLKLSASILLVIILANFQFLIWGFEINSSGIFLILFCYVAKACVKTKKMSYFYLCSFIISIAYVTFLLFEIFDPVWLILKKEWMMGICLSYLSLLLQKTLKERLLMMISGTIHGEILYAFILSNYGFSNPISSLAYLDAISLTTIMLIGWSCIENASAFFDHHFKITEKEKQKLS